MLAQKKVSIIIVNYNGLNHLEACLTSVLSQTYKDFEIIFVDNKSIDGSFEYAKTKFPGLIYVENDVNLGYADGINSALNKVHGDYIAPLNIDTEVDMDWLRNMVNFMESYPKVGAVTPKILLFDRRDTINTMGLNIHVSGLGFCRNLYKQNVGVLKPEPERVSGISGCSFLIRRELLEKIGGMPENCFMGTDDVILSWIINLMDYEIYCIPEAIVFHKYKLKMNPQKFFREEKSRLELIFSVMRPTTLILCSPFFASIEIMMIIYSILKGKRYIKAKFEVFVTLWSERSLILKKRRQYRTLRKISELLLLRKLKWNLDWRQMVRIMS